MPSIIPGFQYDIFISYRQKDNLGSPGSSKQVKDRWVTEFVAALKIALESTFKEDISVYFDENPHDGLSDHHDVDMSLKEKVNCLVFIPVVSQTYCDPKSYAWKNEFLPFLQLAEADRFGLKVKVASGNVSSRTLPIRIHDLEKADLDLLESTLDGRLRSIDFTYKSNGFSRPLTKSDKRKENFNKTFYRDQISKVAIAIKEIIDALKTAQPLDTIQSKTNGLANNVPVPATTLFGRGKELDELATLLGENRIISIIGPGGMGKTRLALEFSSRKKSEFSPIVFVSLAALTKPEEVMPSLANALGIKEAEGRNILKGISSVVGDRNAFIVLDNLEQVIGVAPQVAALLSSCTNLKMLTTSRTPLKISGEYEYTLSPLSLPSGRESKSVDLLLTYPSVSLFVDRARKVNSAFALTHENAGDVVGICLRLDGLPLALELAAARIRMLSPRQLLQRLEHALDILTGGAKDLPERHQTLRATIDWSHSLLSDPEKTLFRRMAVFSGGCTLEGIEETCSDHPELAFEELESLVDKGLVQHAGVPGRFLILQTIKEYALEKLEAAGEFQSTKLKQAAYYQEMAAQVYDGLEHDDQVEIMHRGVLEEENIQSVLDFLLPLAQAGDAVATEIGLTICGNLYFFWHIRGKHMIAKHYAISFLDVPGDPLSLSRGRALNAAGIASWTLGHFEKSLEEFSAAHAIAKIHNEKPTMASVGLGLILGSMALGKMDEAWNYQRENVIQSQEAGSDFNIGFTMVGGAILHTIGGDLDRGQKSYEDVLRLFGNGPNQEVRGLTLGGLALIASIRGNNEESIETYHSALAAFAIIGDRAEEARILEEMAWVFLKIGNATEARRHFLNSIQAYEEIGSVRGIGLALLGIAGVEAVEQHPRNAIEIATAAQLFTEQEGVVNVYGEGFAGKVYIENARKELSATELEGAIQAGKKLSLRDALRRAGFR